VLNNGEFGLCLFLEVTTSATQKMTTQIKATAKMIKAIPHPERESPVGSVTLVGSSFISGVVVFDVGLTVVGTGVVAFSGAFDVVGVVSFIVGVVVGSSVVDVGPTVVGTGVVTGSVVVGWFVGGVVGFVVGVVVGDAVVGTEVVVGVVVGADVVVGCVVGGAVVASPATRK